MKGVFTEREIRVVEYLQQQDEFYKWVRWPEYLRSMSLLDHKSNRDRFTLFFFLTANGLNPDTAEQWVTMSDVVGATIIAGHYDASAWRQMAQLKNQSLDGSLFGKKKRMMNMELGRVTEM